MQHPLVQEVSEKVRDHFRDRLAACDGLRDFALERTRPWGGRPLDPEIPNDPLLAVLLARATTTYWAAIELVRLGFGAQAAMLNRSLFEDMVDAYWSTLDPSVARERYRQHHEHSRMLLAEEAAKHPFFYGEVEIPTFPKDRRAALDDVFGRHGQRSWTGLPTHKRVEAIEHLWEEEAGRDQLRFIHGIAHKENNQTLHLSAFGMERMIREAGPDGLRVSIGPGRDMLDKAMFIAFYVFGYLTRLACRHFELDPDAHLATVFDDQLPYFRDLDAGELRGVERNDPCPCGSGKKFKRCHGAQ